MLTGTDVLNLISWVYWGAAVLALLVAVVLPKTPKRKAICASVVVGLFSILPLYARLGLHERNKQVAQEREKLNVAMARFEERCKTAGEKIYRTVEDVEGVLLANVRPKATSSDHGDPNWPDAALPLEKTGDEYIRTFLYWEQHEDKRTQRGYVNYVPSPFSGYRFVDVKTEDGQIHRYRLKQPKSDELVRESILDKPSRYTVTFSNFVDPEDRKLWIAGTRVVVTDALNEQVLAEHIWYSIDPGQGSTAGFRSPWLFGKTCPLLGEHPSLVPTRFFVDRVLKPKKGE